MTIIEKIKKESEARLARWEEEIKSDSEVSMKEEAIAMSWDYVDAHDVV